MVCFLSQGHCSRNSSMIFTNRKKLSALFCIHIQLNGHGRENKEYHKDKHPQEKQQEPYKEIFQQCFPSSLFIKITHRFIPVKDHKQNKHGCNPAGAFHTPTSRQQGYQHAQ